MYKKNEISFRIRAGGKFIHTGNLNDLKSLNLSFKGEKEITWQICSDVQDRKGNLVFEGDVIKQTLGIIGSSLNYTYLVKFGPYEHPGFVGNGFYLDMVGKKTFYPCALTKAASKHIEVIGNIFDTPEIALDLVV